MAGLFAMPWLERSRFGLNELSGGTAAQSPLDGKAGA